MARTKSPLWGLDASGTLGGEVVYSRWKGIRYARRHVIPANPQTEGQMKTRTVFAFLSDFWSASPALVREPNAAAAEGKPLTDRNVFIGNNVRSLRGLNNLAGLVVSPGVRGGYPLLSLSAQSSDSSVDAVAAVAPLPSGWTVDWVAFVLVSDQDPHELFSCAIDAVADDSAPYSATWTDLDAGDYWVVAYPRYTRPDGRKAYGPSSIVGVTVS